ncbi:17-beta-hydroxysteroid dehydrogenase type 6-like [Podarcis raffonei]|uniref:17-beta-hydroxysteroid dehydrogenase type 6-like n=1 Tax=Podarcis raffonei TaxID=65483 RepID=UPI0023293195|nr:17-beta-hydroxysteroid dehydrogenase type 6-like [Podarcis raffonei]
MWLYLAALLGLYFLRRWYQERQTVENLTEKYVFITGCSSGFGNHLARHLDARGLRVLATCTTQKGAEQLDKVTSERLKTTVLDVTSTESVAAATEWVKDQVGKKDKCSCRIMSTDQPDSESTDIIISGYGRQLDARGLRVLAACLTQKGAEQLGKATSERLKTTILDVTSRESVAAATEWVKEQFIT